MPKQINRSTRKKPLPFEPGEVVGLRGQRATVVVVPVTGLRRVKVRLPSGAEVWADIELLHDPPPLPDNVQQAVDEAVASGIFADPRAAVFGKS